MSKPIHSASDKRTSLDALAAMVTDGDCVAVGGGLSSREPMAMLRALIRQGRTGLNVVGSAHGIDIDLLCGAGAVAVTGESYVGFEQDFGMAPNYRRGCESGAIVVEDSCCATLVAQLRAAIQGVPFMPIRSVRGTDFERLHPEYKNMVCPFTNEELLLVPALAPDVAVLHTQYGDQRGNLRIEGPPVADVLFAKAARTVLATVEQLVTSDELREKGGANIPGLYVTALAEVRFGAHPTACYPFYAYDRPHTAAYYAAAKDGPEAFEARYLGPYVRDREDHESYLEAIGGEAVLSRLASWKDGDEAWADLYRAEVER